MKINEQAIVVGLRYNKLFDERKLKAINEEINFIENGKKPEADKDVPAEHSARLFFCLKQYPMNSFFIPIKSLRYLSRIFSHINKYVRFIA